MMALTLMGCPGNDPTTLTSSLNNPISLMVVGDTLFWIEDDTNGTGEDPSKSVIRSMPTKGGTVTTVLTQPHLDGNLTSDGTNLYFSFTIDTNGNAVSTIGSCSLTGGSVNTLTSGTVRTDKGQDANGHTEMFAVNGSLIFKADNVPQSDADPVISNVYSMPTGGGTPGIISQLPSPPTAASLVNNLYFADSTGAYFSWISTPISTGSSTFYFSVIPPGGGEPTNFESIPAASISPSSNMPGVGQVTEVNGTVFFAFNNLSNGTVELHSVPAAGGSPSTVATYSNESNGFLVGDANGLYLNNSVASNNPGIISVSLSGTATQFYTDQKALSTSVGNSRVIAIDSKNVYWVAGGFNGGQGTIHTKAR
jgi:hypothetical protein